MRKVLMQSTKMADALPGSSKEDNFCIIIIDGRKHYECKICGRRFTTKFSVLCHLKSTHGMSPVKRTKKRYLEDLNIPVPRSTLYYKKKKNTLALVDGGALFTVHVQEKEDAVNPDNVAETSCGSAGDPYRIPDTCSVDADIPKGWKSTEDGPQSEVQIACLEDGTADLHTSNEESGGESENKSELFGNSSSDFDTTTDDDDDDDDDLSDGYEHDSTVDSDTISPVKAEMAILSCFLRNNLPASACKDVLLTMKNAFPNCSSLKQMKYNSLWAHSDDYAKEIHFCESCSEIFPDNKKLLICGNCSSPRYKQSQLPRASFVLANIKRQFTNLLKSPGLWENIEKNKKLIRTRHIENSGVITDITDGSVYKTLTQKGGFLNGEKNINLTVIMNTDGLCLYSSSKVQLWPIFLAVNELSPNMRFARENIILAGIWQGKGKPPLKPLLHSFSLQMNDLYEKGIDIELDDEDLNIKIKILCGTFDLPAKAAVLNMTQYNGKQSCISCEDPGESVRQGKGSSWSFPYKSVDERSIQRTDSTVRSSMAKGNESKRDKGFKGLSALVHLKSFDFVKGTPPDYMHASLLGVTKTLMYKWFSATQSKSDYFIGDKLKEISRRLKCIQPPEFMERLPRDLEKNYSNFKATELQAWLIYYALPCVNGILKEKYLQHFALISEGIYLLLGDNITLNELQRAELLLDSFYKQFTDLYSGGSCGLNVHNIGYHFVAYVKLLGPLWCWSCFPFEDCNSMLTKAVHGTGNVMKQVMKIKEAQTLLRNHLPVSYKARLWSNLKNAKNCKIAGAMTDLQTDEYSSQILIKLGVDDLQGIKRVARVMLNGKKFYSAIYSRMKRRLCYTFLTTKRTAVLVKYFISHLKSGLVYAVVLPLKLSEWGIGDLSAGSHLAIVDMRATCEVLLVDELCESLWFIDVKAGDNKFIARMPNMLGHSVFK